MTASDQTAAPRLRTEIAGLPSLVGAELGPTEWWSFSQQEINQFADLTRDHNPVHIDPVAAAKTVFGGTVAHGFLTASMLAPTTQYVIEVTDAAFAINYGLDRLRFPAPVRVGDRFRGVGKLLEVTEIKGGAQVKCEITLEIEGSDKPAVVAECLVRYYS